MRALLEVNVSERKAMLLSAACAALAVLAAGCATPAAKTGARPLPDEVAVPAPGEAVPWPGVISIFTKGAGWPQEEKEAEAYLAAVREAGFGAYHADPDKLPALRRHGLKLFADCDDEVRAARRLRDEPDVLGYWMRYPTLPRHWPELAPLEKRRQAADPNHPGLYAFEATWGQADQYVGILKPRAIWFRHYLWEPYDAGRFVGARWAPMNEFIYLEAAREAALKAGGLPIVRWVHVAEPAHMRYTVNMSLLYGIRGFTWWQGWCFFDLQKKDDRGIPLRNELGGEVASLNRTMKAFAPVFEQARCVGVYHCWPYDLFLLDPPKDYWAQPGGAFVSMGVFRAREEKDYTWFTLANRDWERPREAELSFSRKVERVEIVDRETGAWKPLTPEPVENGHAKIRLTLAEAQVELLRVKPQQ